MEVKQENQIQIADRQLSSLDGLFGAMPLDIQNLIFNRLSNKNLACLAYASKQNYQYFKEIYPHLIGYLKARKFLRKNFIKKNKENGERYSANDLADILEKQTQIIKNCNEINPWFTYYFVIHFVKHYLFFNPNLQYLSPRGSFDQGDRINRLIDYLKNNFFDHKEVFTIPNNNTFCLSIKKTNIKEWPFILEIKKKDIKSACVLFEKWFQPPEVTPCPFDFSYTKKIYFAFAYENTAQVSVCAYYSSLKTVMEIASFDPNRIHQLTLLIGDDYYFSFEENIQARTKEQLRIELPNLKRLFLNAPLSEIPTPESTGFPNLSLVIFNATRTKTEKCQEEMRTKGELIPLSDNKFKIIAYNKNEIN